MPDQAAADKFERRCPQRDNPPCRRAARVTCAAPRAMATL